MEKELFVSHTDSALKKYFKKQDFLVMNIYLGKVNETKFIYFNTLIQSKSAYDSYGSLRVGSNIMIKTDSGMVTLKIGSSDTGDTDYDKGTTKYSVYCILRDEDIAILSNSKSTKLRIYWSKGYDNYDIDDADLISRQLKCLK